MVMNRPPEVVKLTKRPEGEYSTILHPDGTLETILFLKDGGTIGPVFNVPNISVIHTEHIKRLSERYANG